MQLFSLQFQKIIMILSMRRLKHGCNALLYRLITLVGQGSRNGDTQLNWVRNININIYTHCSPCQVAFTAIINWISVILKFSVFGKADLFSSPWPLTDKTKTFTIMYAVFIQITLSPIAKMTVSEGSLLIRLVCLVFFPHTI